MHNGIEMVCLCSLIVITNVVMSHSSDSDFEGFWKRVSNER